MNDFHDLIKDEGWTFKLRVWWIKHWRFPRAQRQWNNACEVIKSWDYYVISDHDHYAAVKAGLWHADYDVAAEHGRPHFGAVTPPKPEKVDTPPSIAGVEHTGPDPTPVRPLDWDEI